MGLVYKLHHATSNPISATTLGRSLNLKKEGSKNKVLVQIMAI